FPVSVSEPALGASAQARDVGSSGSKHANTQLLERVCDENVKGLLAFDGLQQERARHPTDVRTQSEAERQVDTAAQPAARDQRYAVRNRSHIQNRAARGNAPLGEAQAQFAAPLALCAQRFDLGPRGSACTRAIDAGDTAVDERAGGGGTQSKTNLA